MEGAGPQILGTGAKFNRVPCQKGCRVNRVKNYSSYGVNLLDKPGGLLSPWCMKSLKRPRILKVTESNLIIF